MDTAFYYFKSKGEEKGPYKFYQLQQLRTNEQLRASDFTPEEWEHLTRFVETGEISKTRFIRRQDETVAKSKDRPLLKHLTYVSYGIAFLFIVQGLIQGRHDYLLRWEPAFYLGLIFSIALCHMCIDRAIHVRLSRQLESSLAAVFVWYIGGLLPLAATIALVAAAAQMMSRTFNLSAQEILHVGTKYLAAGAVVSLYRPFYLRTIAIDEKLIKRKYYSIRWLMGLVMALGLIAFYLAPINSLPPQVLRCHSFLYPGRSGVNSKLTWQFSVQLGDNTRIVERALGKPDEVLGREHIYRSAGVRLMFDDAQRVAKIRFAGDEGAQFHKTPILGGISPQSNLRQIQSILEIPPATFSESNTDTSVWVETPYRIMGCFWKDGAQKNNKMFKAGDLKWIEISLEE